MSPKQRRPTVAHALRCDPSCGSWITNSQWAKSPSSTDSVRESAEEKLGTRRAG